MPLSPVVAGSRLAEDEVVLFSSLFLKLSKGNTLLKNVTRQHLCESRNGKANGSLPNRFSWRRARVAAGARLGRSSARFQYDVWMAISEMHDKRERTGRKSWPKGPARTESMVPGSRSIKMARGT